MAIGQLPVHVACDVPDGIALRMEDVDGIGVPSMSMAVSMKLSFPIHDLLKMLVSWREHEARSSQHVPPAQAAEESPREATELCESAKFGPVPLRNSPAYVSYKAQNGWERISAPKGALLEDERKLRAVAFQALPRPEHRARSYADFKEDPSSVASVAAATADAATCSPGPLLYPKAPPPAWESPAVPQKTPRRRSAPVLLAVDIKQVGNFLGEAFSLSHTIRLEFLNSVVLQNTGVVSALIQVFHMLQLPDDLQKINRLVHGVARIWWRQHERMQRESSGAVAPRKPPAMENGALQLSLSQELNGLELKQYLSGSDVLHQLMFSTVMLHWYLYRDGPNGQKKDMDFDTWQRQNRGIETNGTNVPDHVQQQVYALVNKAFIPELAVASAQKKPEGQANWPGWQEEELRAIQEDIYLRGWVNSLVNARCKHVVAADRAKAKGQLSNVVLTHSALTEHKELIGRDDRRVDFVDDGTPLIPYTGAKHGDLRPGVSIVVTRDQADLRKNFAERQERADVLAHESAEALAEDSLLEQFDVRPVARITMPGLTRQQISEFKVACNTHENGLTAASWRHYVDKDVEWRYKTKDGEINYCNKIGNPTEIIRRAVDTVSKHLTNMLMEIDEDTIKRALAKRPIYLRCWSPFDKPLRLRLGLRLRWSARVSVEICPIIDSGKPVVNQDSPVPASTVQNPARKKGKGAGNTVTAAAQPEPTTPAPASAAKGKAKGKPENADSGWTKVQRKKPPPDTEEFRLRQQDWTDPLVSFASLAKKLEDTKDDQVCRGIVLCTQHESKIASSLFAGTAKQHDFLITVLTKNAASEAAKATGAVRQQVPGQVGLMLRSAEALVYQVHSPGQTVPQPVGASAVPLKVAPKATAVLFCKVLQSFTSTTMWKGFTEKPQKQIALYTAQHHVLCNDRFGCAEELTKPGCRQVFGIIRVAQTDLSVLLALSGEQGIFFQLPKDRVKHQHVEWATLDSRAEQDFGMASPCGCQHQRHQSLGAANAPRDWDMNQVSQLLAEYFSEVPANEELMLIWCPSLCKFRQVEYRQRQIKAGAVPFKESKSILDPVAVAPHPHELRARMIDHLQRHTDRYQEGSTNVGGGQWSRSLVGPNANVHLNDSLADVEVVMGGQMLSRGAGERSARG
ncbi:unnamed protein product [Symbiodinium microadriaticum]|nr:unnamed protein product [Symbiodinium microadriaticum]